MPRRLWYQPRVRSKGREYRPAGWSLGATVAVTLVLSTPSCHRDGEVRAPASETRQLTLAVGAGPKVPSALPALVRLVAEQELRRAGLHKRVRTSTTGVLALILERRKAGTNRLSLHLFRTTRALESRFDFGRCCAPAHVAELRRQIRLLLRTVTGVQAGPTKPLWRGSPYNRDQLNDALAAGVHWLLARAHRTGAFELSDLQQVFLILQESARDPALRRLAAKEGPRLATRFLRMAPKPRTTSPMEQLFDHAAGTYFAQRFGVKPSTRYRKDLRAAFRGLQAVRLKRHRKAANPARDLLDDLVDLYFPYKLGLNTPHRYVDIVTRAARYPFLMLDGETPNQLEDRMYLATHIVYVLSDFNESLLQERSLKRVVRFLERAGRVYLAARDVETLGEVGDALKIVGRDYSDPLLRRVVALLLRGQNADGSWGNMKDTDAYRRYHTTWTCFNGLLEFRFTKRGMSDQTIRAAWHRGLKLPPTRMPPLTPPRPRPSPR